jgi:MFS family permease
LSADHPETIRWRAALAAISTISVIGIALGLGVPLLSVVLEKQGYSATVIGANTAIAGIAALMAAPLGPRIAHRLGLPLAMAIMIAVVCLTFLGFHWLPSLSAWFVLRFIMTFAITTLFILSEFWISAVTPPARRGLLLGIYATVLSLGFAAGPAIFGYTGSSGGLPFFVGAAVTALALIPLAFAWKEGVEVKEGRIGGFVRYIWLAPTATAAVLVYGAVETGGFALFPVYGARIGMSETESAMLLSAIGLGNVALQIPLGLISDRVRDRRIVLVICAAVGLAGIMVLPEIIDNWWAAAATLFIWGGVVAGLYTVGLAHLASRTPAAALAQANAAFVFCYALGMLLGPQGIGFLMDAMGPNGFAYALAFFFSAYLVLTGVRIGIMRR